MSPSSSAGTLIQRPDRILLVEDDEFSSQLIVMYLEKAGFSNIVVARDGREALDSARGNPFDLMLLDLNLPRLTGAEVLRRLKKGDLLSRTAVLIISSLSNMEDTATCMELGAEDFLPKPFNRQLLESRVLGILERRRLRVELREEQAQSAIQAAQIRDFCRGHNRLAATAFPNGGALLQGIGERVDGTSFTTMTLPDGHVVAMMADSLNRTPAGMMVAKGATMCAHQALIDMGNAINPTAVLRVVAEAQSGQEESKLTMVLAVFNPTTQKLALAVAGAPSPMVIVKGQASALDLGASGPLAPGSIIASLEQEIEGDAGLFLYNRATADSGGDVEDLVADLQAHLTVPDNGQFSPGDVIGGLRQALDIDEGDDTILAALALRL